MFVTYSLMNASYDSNSLLIVTRSSWRPACVFAAAAGEPPPSSGRSPVASLGLSGTEGELGSAIALTCLANQTARGGTPCGAQARSAADTASRPPAPQS